MGYKIVSFINPHGIWQINYIGPNYDKIFGSFERWL